MKTNDLKETKAITLIALVVTIVVLLILAGVSIAVLTGENGILNRATEAKKTNEESEVMENIRLAYNNAQIGKYSGKNENFAETMQADLRKNYQEAMVTENEDGTYLIVVKGKKYTITSTGDVAPKTGIILNKTNLSLQIVDETAISEKLTATLDGITGNISWKIAEGTSIVELSSSAGNIITVTPKLEGNAKIVAECGNESVECNVTVTNVVLISTIELSVERNLTEIDAGEQNAITITATVNSGATERIIWTSSDTTKVNVTGNGIIDTSTNTTTATITGLAAAEGVTIKAVSDSTYGTENEIKVEYTLDIIAPVETAVKITPNGGNSLMSNNISQSTVACLYGQPISYTPTGKLADRATSDVWRIFYIDTEGNYGNKGAVYLKMDCDVNNKPIKINVTSTQEELKRIAKHNPLWANGSKTMTLNYVYGSNSAVAYLYDEDEWGIYANSYAEYAVGGVPLEIWVASYNSLINNTSATGTLILPSINASGYTYNSNANYFVSFTNLSGSNNMYCPNSNVTTYWLASPSGSGSNNMCEATNYCRIEVN